jgi:hypothetical protein
MTKMTPEENRAYYRKYKADNKERLRYQEQVRHREWRAELLKIVGDHKCKDCGNDDFRVLEFDHIGDDKTANVARFISRNWRKSLEEALKCEVVCANCHKIRTFERYPKLSPLQEEWKRLSETHCPQGHEKIPENRVTYDGKEGCRICRRDAGARYREKQKEIT